MSGNRAGEDRAQTMGCTEARYNRKSAVRRRHFASQLVSELTTMCDGAAKRNRFSDAVEMWLEAPCATLDEQAAIAALCTHALRVKDGYTAAFATDSERKSGSEVLSMPTEFLSQPFVVPYIGPLGKCQLCRDTMSRVFVNPFLDSFFRKLFLSITHGCNAQGFDVSLSPYDLFHGHLLLLDQGSGGVCERGREN
jgi:hypothetical protein